MNHLNKEEITNEVKELVIEKILKSDLNIKIIPDYIEGKLYDSILDIILKKMFELSSDNNLFKKLNKILNEVESDEEKLKIVENLLVMDIFNNEIKDRIITSILQSELNVKIIPDGIEEKIYSVVLDILFKLMMKELELDISKEQEELLSESEEENSGNGWRFL